MHASPPAFVQQYRRVQRHARNSDAYSFFNLLTGPELFEQVESLLPPHRERLSPPTETLSIFLAQALSADHSCQKAVDEAALRRVAAGLSACSTHTGAYCRARERLPVEMVRTLARYTGRWITAHAPQSWCWRGRPVRLVDGTTVVLPDTPANQAQYPQSRSQKPGLGFPLCRLVGVVCLGSGAVLDAATGPFRGKGTDERSLLRALLDTLVSLRQPQMGVPSLSRESLVRKKRNVVELYDPVIFPLRRHSPIKTEMHFVLRLSSISLNFLRTLLGNCRREIHIFYPSPLHAFAFRTTTCDGGGWGSPRQGSGSG